MFSFHDKAPDMQDEGVESMVPSERCMIRTMSELSERSVIGRPLGRDKEEPGDAHATARADLERVIVEHVSQMALTNERFLRATPAHHVIECAGRALRSGHRPIFAHSQRVEKISRFLSHSWHVSWFLKTLTLQLFYNWKPAVLVSNLGALLGMILASLDVLPGLERTPRWGTEAMVVGTWSLSLGLLSFLLVWFFWAPREMVFLDRLCINQEDQQEKAEALINLGACLKQSKHLLVVFDETYCQRLWCLFELAGFLATHQDSAIYVQPVSLTIFIAVRFLQSYLLWYVQVLLPHDSMLTTLVLICGICLNGWLFGAIVLRYEKEVQLMKSRLQSFTFEEAFCLCCSVSHRDPLDPEETVLCDREIMRKCVKEWFGSVEDFELAVRTRVKDALSLSLGGTFCPYSLLLASGLPILWGSMDLAAARFLQQDMATAIGLICLGLSTLLIGSPLVLSVILISIRHLATRRFSVKVRQLLLAVVASGTYGIMQLIVQLCERYFGTLLGLLVNGLILLVPAVILWRCAG